MSEIKDRTIQDILQILDKVVVNASELSRWTWSIETTAKCMSDDKSGNITFEYYSDEKIIKFFVTGTIRPVTARTVYVFLSGI